MNQPTLQPWMITIIQRWALEESRKLTLTPDVKKQIRAVAREKGAPAGRALEERFITAAKEDAKNGFTEIGKVQKIIERLDEIGEFQSRLMSA